MTMPAERAFLSVIAWPAGWERTRCADLLADRAGLDLPTMQLCCVRNPPAILGELDPESCRRACDAIRAHGGDAFAPTLNDIQSLGPTIKIKDIRIESGRFHFDLWRKPPASIAFNDVQILVRARVRESNAESLPTDFSLGTRIGTQRIRYGPYGAYGLAARLAAPVDEFEVEPIRSSRSTAVSHKLDIHTADGRVFQVDADKFGFGVLGEMRGHSDPVNIDRLCDLFAHLAPNEIIDPYFSLWKPPAGVRSLRLPEMQVNNDDPHFAFYSRWAALMYQHLLGQDRPAPH